jgi:iron complex outermembrane receptor protein
MPTNFTISSTTGFFNPNADLKLSRRDQFEVGFRYYPLDWLGVETTVYRLKTYDDGFTDPVTDNYEQAGQTTREGIEFSLQASPAKNWRITGNFAYMEAKYDKHLIGLQDMANHRLAWVPRKITNIEISYAPELGLGGRLSLRHEADMLYQDYPRTLTNGQLNLSNGVLQKPWKAPDKTFLDLQLSYTFNETIKLLLDAKNIIGNSYEGYAYGKNFSNGDYLVNYLNPRAFYLTLIINTDVKKE